MVADDDAGPGGGEVALAGDDDEADVCGEAHDEGEGAGGEVLREAVAAERAEEERD